MDENRNYELMVTVVGPDGRLTKLGYSVDKFSQAEHLVEALHPGLEIMKIEKRLVE